MCRVVFLLLLLSTVFRRLHYTNEHLQPAATAAAENPAVRPRRRGRFVPPPPPGEAGRLSGRAARARNALFRPVGTTRTRASHVLFSRPQTVRVVLAPVSTVRATTARATLCYG